MSPSLSTAALAWLACILEERFGHVFTLTLHPTNTLRITIDSDAPYIELPHDGITFTRADSDLPCTHWNATDEGWQTPLASILPAPGVKLLPLPLIELTAQGYSIHYDILGLAYWMLTRQEEVGRKDLDTHGRFPATSSHAFKHGYLERPIVDEWLHILGQVISRTWPSVGLKKNEFSIKVSHDVDMPSRYAFRPIGGLIRAMAGDVLKRGCVKSALMAPWIRMNSKFELQAGDPANTFDMIMNVSERQGIVSAFYFICGRTEPNRDADYEPEHPAIRSLMRHMHARGHEIGLHPSYGSYRSPSIIKQEADRLQKIAAEEGIKQSSWGGRMHYLRWDQQITLQALADAGMTYDSTLGYADLPGFRCGTCFEYTAFDLMSQKILSLKIRPLIAMDITIIDKAYMGIEQMEKQLEKFIMFKNICKIVKGSYALLWHNDMLSVKENQYVYKKIIEE